MRVARERLLFHALSTLEAEAHRSRTAGAIPRGPHIRLALGVLYAFSPNEAREEMLSWHVTFCEYLSDRTDTDTRTSAGFGRWQMLNSCLNGMARAAGIERGPAYDAARRRLYGENS